MFGYGLIVGLVVGGSIGCIAGVIIASMCVAASEADKRMGIE
jgi:hypothetical protein